MSQYYARINIEVNSPDTWKLLSSIDPAVFSDAGLTLEPSDFSNFEGTSFVLDGDWSCDENNLMNLVASIADSIGEAGVVIADTQNINTDPHTYLIYYLGDVVRNEFYSSDDDEESSAYEKHFVFTGKLNFYENREELKDYIVEECEGYVSDSVSAKTDYLICNDPDSTSSKTRKAKELGIPIITEKEFIILFGYPEDFDMEEKEGFGKLWGFHDNANIESINDCLEYYNKCGELVLSKKEQEVLAKLGFKSF